MFLVPLVLICEHKNLHASHEFPMAVLGAEARLDVEQVKCG